MVVENVLEADPVSVNSPSALVDTYAQTAQASAELFNGKKKPKKEMHIRQKIDDEFLATPSVSIDILQPVIFETEDNKGKLVTRDYSEKIRSEFKYLSATKALETGSARSDILQEYVDKMVLGNPEWEGKVRVAIMNKGKEPSAFAYPDGSIFISQSLIDLYDSLDEVIAIMAHEVKHLINGTTRAAFVSEVKYGASLGVDWLHEMASDFGSAELLEKVHLKSTASAEVLTKLAAHFGNRRGTEHQAPIMRAIEQLGIHTVKDYETSHLDFTALPPELRKAFQMTNIEAIIDAASKEDVEAVEQYLPKLHPRDFGKFFSIADYGYYGDYVSSPPKNEAVQAVSQKTGELVVKRLLAEGLSQDEIKLFFLCTTRGHSYLSPKFEDIPEVTGYVGQAERMYRENTVQRSMQLLFDNEKSIDPLSQLLETVKYRVKKFSNTKESSYTDIDSFADLLGAFSACIQEDLPVVKDGSFVDSEGRTFSYRENRPAYVHESLISLLFNYIEYYYLPNVADGELDQEQIEDVFETVKEAGFEPLVHNYFFPIQEKNIGKGNRTIIEAAYLKVYGVELVRQDAEEEVKDLPTVQEFKQLLSDLPESGVSSHINSYARVHSLNIETRAEYVQAAVEHYESVDFSNHHLRGLVRDKIGYTAMDNWEEYGDPKWDAMQAHRAALKNIFNSGTVTQDGEPLVPRTLTLEDVIQEYGLNGDELHAEANRKGEIDRATFQINLVTDTVASSEETLFAFIEPIMRGTRIDKSLLDQYELLSICSALFKLTNVERVTKFQENRIRDFDRFYQLDFIQELVGRIENVSFTDIGELNTYVTEAKKRYGQYPINAKYSLYEDDVYSVLLAKPVRDELSRLTAPGKLRQQDYPALIQLLDREFPYSPQRRMIVKNLLIAYINDPEIVVQDKIDFYFNQYKLLGLQGAILVAEQISDIPTYQAFKQKLDQLALEYISGEESLNGVAMTDIASSFLTKKADVLIKTASESRSDSQDVSTKMAILWVETYLEERGWRVHDAEYDKKSGKFILTESGRAAFATLNDTIDYFKNLSDSQKLGIALKAMSDQDGLLVTEEGRKLLEKMLVEGLGLSQEFFKQVLGSAIRKGDAKVVGLPAAQMLAPFMFRALNVEAVDIKKVRNAEVTDRDSDKYVKKMVKQREYSEDLPTIFRSNTRDIRYFGFRYYHQPESVLAQQAQESGSSYFATLENLKSQVVDTPEATVRAEGPVVSASTEAMIKAGETSPVFVRGMQMAVQLIDFEQDVRERLSHTQDSMKGMEKLRFWENLLSKAQGDPELARFLEQDLITLDSYLGGGSLFTTYGATVRGKDGLPKKVVIKMLNPNAEEFIRLSYTFSTTVLDEVEQNTRGKTRQTARLASSLLNLSNTWCIRDINDTTYAEQDDAFRLIVQSYNELQGSTAIDAPERIYTSKKVKVEEQYNGTTLNKFLANSDVSNERKQEVVTNLLGFFHHQFEFSPQSLPDGRKVFLFHSDPHAGNYMIDPKAEGFKLGAIDRSMYLALEERDVKMFQLLKSGSGAKFINGFIERCLEVNGFDGNEATRIRYRVLNQLGGELLRQSLSRRADTSAYLQIIMQEFAKYGEKFSTLENASGQSMVERTITDYFSKHPETESLQAYDALKENLLNGDNGTRLLTYQQFKELLGKMKRQGFLHRKSIEIPLEYRLMIRNIVAMQNLQERWT